MLLDTGASISLIKLKYVKEKVDNKEIIDLIGLGNTSQKTLGSTNLRFSIRNETEQKRYHRWGLHVIPNNVIYDYDGLLGADFLREMKCKIDYGNNMLYIDNEKESYELKFKNKDNYIMPRQEAFRMVKLKEKLVDGTSVVVSKFENENIIVPNCISTVKDGKCLVSVLNISNKKILNDISVETACLNDFHVYDGINSYSERKGKKQKNKFVYHVQDKMKIVQSMLRLNHLNKEEENKLRSLITKYNDLFVVEGESLTFTNVMECKIRTKEDVKPVYTKSYRYPKVHEKEVECQLETLLKNGMVKHSKSPWSSPVWVVPKKTDASGKSKWRIVIDYRKLNELTIADSYPIPNIAEILDQLGTAKYFTTLDLYAGFHQIKVQKEDVEKTAFSTPQGHFEFTRMPFGLKNAPSIFQRMMDIVLSGLKGIKCFVYMDDIVVYGKDLKEHNERLEDVFKQLRLANLKLQADKSEFLRKEVSYLGHLIGEDGVKPNLEKIKVIESLKAPQNVKEIQSFLGMMNYYRKFIENFSQIASPINNLLRKDVEFRWGRVEQEAFMRLKNALSNFTVLQYPDFNRKFIVTTDASNAGLGAVLSQEHENKDLPIQFISRSLNKNEKNYSTTEKECLAIVWAVKVLRPYLYGQEFIIRTDHKPLKWLFNVKDPGSRLVRWRLKLEEYSYSIEYKKGLDNVVADHLSRNILVATRKERKKKKCFCDCEIKDNAEYNKEIEYENQNEIEVRENNEDSLKDKKDEIQSNQYEHGIVSEYDDNIQENCRKSNEITEVTDMKKQIDIIKEYHESLTGGHAGQKATIEKIREKYNWKNLNQMVIDFIKSCKNCQLGKIDRHPTRMPMTMVSNASYSLEQVNMDLTGPYPISKKENVYALSIQDSLSKFVRFIPIKDKYAETVAEAFVNDWITYLGIPKIILTDNGTEFCNELMKNLAKIFKIKHITTSVAHPQSNGSVERIHGRLKEYLNTVNFERENWDEALKFAGFCYNTTIHSTTGYSPHEVLFGRQANRPSGIDTLNLTTVQDYVQNVLEHIVSIENKVKENLVKSKLKSKENYDRKTNRAPLYKVGEKVLVKNLTKNKKLENTFVGPFLITKVTDTNIFVKTNRKIRKLSKNLVKPYLTH